MELNRKSNSPCFENPNLTSCDFSPQEPHQPITQKVLKFDVPDISVISDSASEGGSALYSKTFGSRAAFSRIPKYHQTSPYATSGFNKTPVISTESENSNHAGKMYEPISNQCRIVKFHKPNLNAIDSHKVLTTPLSRQRSPVSVLHDECNNSSVQSFNRPEKKVVNKLDRCSFKSNLHHDCLQLHCQNICGTDTFDNPTGSNKQLNGDIISDVNSDLNLCRNSPDSISVPSYSTIPVCGEHHSIQSPHYECVTENEVNFTVCANNQAVLKSPSGMPLNSSIPEYVGNFSRHPVSHMDKYRESKDKENGLIPSENTSKQTVSSAQFQNKCSCCIMSSSVSAKSTTGTSSLNSISAANVENVNECLIEKPEMDVWKYLKEQDKKLHNLQSQISLFLQQKESCCSAEATEQKSRRMPEHKSLDMELSHGLSEDNQYEMNLNQSFILRYLKEHNDQICRLQDQVDLLLRRTEELVSFHSEKDKNRSTPEPITFSDNKCDSSLKEPNFDLADDICQVNGDAAVVCQEQTQVKKTSTSTMTSLTLEGSDKLVYRKMLTVVTGFSNCQKDVSAQCSQRKGSPVSDTQAKTAKIDKDSPKSQKETVRKDRYNNTTPKSAGFNKQDQKPQKRSLKKSKKTNLELHHQNGQMNLNRDNNSDSPGLSPQLRTNNDKCASPLFDSDRENKLVNQSPNEKILPLYESIVRNINQLILENDNQNDSEPSPSGAKHLQKSSGNPSACKTKSPHAVLSPTKRNVKPRRSSSRRSSSTSSNTSIDSFYESPQTRFEESSTISCYGCSSPNLSLATKQYLEKNGLVGRRSSSHNDDSERKSSKKSRTPACRRQLR